MLSVKPWHQHCSLRDDVCTGKLTRTESAADHTPGVGMRRAEETETVGTRAAVDYEREQGWPTR